MSCTTRSRCRTRGRTLPARRDEVRPGQGRITVIHFVALLLVGWLSVGVAGADEAPISGTVKNVDTSAQTVTIETTAKGKTREVTVFLKPGAKVVKFVRPTEPGKSGFVEQS